MDEVPLISVKCGGILKKQSDNCCLAIPDKNEPRLDFVCEAKDGEILKLHCRNITAIDLRVEAKFGSIDAMKGTLLIECSVVKTKHPVNESMNEDLALLSGNSGESCLVRASFHVNETGAIRDLLRKLKGIYTSTNLDENTSIRHPNGSSETSSQTNTKHLKEGLPKWVEYIPHFLYSKRTRQCIQLAIYVYLVFSVMWALWQLYRYVEFVREFLRPLIDFLQYQYRLLDYAIRFFNTIFEEYTVQWLCFIKPLYTVASTMAAPVLQTVAQLRPLLQIVAQSVTSSCAVMWPVVKPIANVAYQLGYFLFGILQGLKNLVGRLWFPFVNVSIPSIFGTYFRAVKQMLLTLWQSLGQTQLDPLRAQLLIVRATVIQSCRALGFGVARLAQKINQIIWLRRSARVEMRFKKQD
ncbi:uncharacterized protein LOC114526985 [Dendronephthya gigantea]|uniref:uncharacterized protein LOC114526985 n=1 Tax=Dendronephthya gigantea TaxID=151771 RepID=UPI00106B01C9|nr:uncharacterized protein LOC114526985 [Dendronephthya gigantea]